ncbi:MAG: hypothetical protein IT331_25705 [Anaerolineae bacterium]|nr:hypothetical protein [Anaerolineae bacterium]
MSNPKPLMRAGNWQLGKNLPPTARKAVNDPALFAFFGALGLVVIASIIALILGLAEAARQADENSNLRGGR